MDGRNLFWLGMGLCLGNYLATWLGFGERPTERSFFQGVTLLTVWLLSKYVWK
jgi:hypothetical protein